MELQKIFNTQHRTKWEEKIWAEIADFLADKKSQKDFKETLNRLLSREEKRSIIRRVAVLELLKAGKSYSEISEVLWVSPVTISTIKKNFWSKSEHYKSWRLFSGEKKKAIQTSKIKSKKLAWEELFRDLDIWELLKNPPRPSGLGFKNAQS